MDIEKNNIFLKSLYGCLPGAIIKIGSNVYKFSKLIEKSCSHNSSYYDLYLNDSDEVHHGIKRIYICPSCVKIMNNFNKG